MKIWFVGRKTSVFLLTIVVLFFAILIISRFSDSKAVSVANVSKRDLPIYYVQKDENDKKISISFDAAWGNDWLLKQKYFPKSFLKYNSGI